MDFAKNFAPPPGIRPSFLAPGQGIRQKNCPGGRDSLAQKQFPGAAGGACTQLELAETFANRMINVPFETGIGGVRNAYSYYSSS